MQMLKDRGYLIADDKLNMTVQQLKAKMQEGSSAEGALNCQCLNNIYKKKTGELLNEEDPEEMEESEDKIAVFWCCDQDKVNSDTVKNVQIQSTMLGVLRAIMIVKD